MQDLGKCNDSWACVLLGVSSALITQKLRATSASHLHSQESQNVTIGVNITPSFSFDRFIRAVFSAVGGVAVPATAAFGNEVDHMPDHLVIDRHEVPPGVNDRS